MCDKCEAMYNFGVKANLHIVNNKFTESLGWEDSTDIVVQDGKAIIKDDYIITINDTDVILMHDTKEIDYFSHNMNYRHIESIIKKIDFRLRSKYYETLRETINSKMEAVVKYKVWTAIVDSKTCPYCKELNGQSKPIWALFWINIKGKTYSLGSPPLHWNVLKDGSMKISCRCHLEYTTKAGKKVTATGQKVPVVKEEEVPVEQEKDIGEQ